MSSTAGAAVSAVRYALFHTREKYVEGFRLGAFSDQPIWRLSLTSSPITLPPTLAEEICRPLAARIVASSIFATPKPWSRRKRSPAVFELSTGNSSAGTLFRMLWCSPIFWSAHQYPDHDPSVFVAYPALSSSTSDGNFSFRTSRNTFT